MVYFKKRYEKAVEKMTRIRNAEIGKLKKAFAQVSEQRKMAYMKMQGKMKAAIQAFRECKSENNRLESQIGTLQQELERAKASLLDVQQRHKQYVNSILQGKSELQKQIMDEQLAVSKTKESLQLAQSEIAVVRSALEQIANSECKQEELEARIETKVKNPQTGTAVTLIPQAPGKYKVQWYRSFRGGSFTPIEGRKARKMSYIPTADDVGAVLRGKLTSEEGMVVYAEIGPIGVSVGLLTALMKVLKKSEAKLTPLLTAEGQPCSKAILVNRMKIKLRDGKKTSMKVNHLNG